MTCRSRSRTAVASGAYGGTMSASASRISLPTRYLLLSAQGIRVRDDEDSEIQTEIAASRGFSGEHARLARQPEHAEAVGGAMLPE